MKLRNSNNFDTQLTNLSFNWLTTILFYFSILIFIIGFNFTDVMIGNWYQQFMPNINGRTVTEVFFLDSLNSWAVTNKKNQSPDTAYVLITTNSGDDWVIQYRKLFSGGGFPAYTGVYFINQNTGFACGTFGIEKTTNSGTSWAPLFSTESFEDMSVIDENRIWVVSSSSFVTGGVYNTTNGGLNWIHQLDLGSLNPNKIYMFNSNIGFITEEGGGTRYVRKTVDGGYTWSEILTNDDFRDIEFADSSTGWKCSVFGMKKTTDGGLNWSVETIPSGGIIQNGFIGNFDVLNKDTLFGTGGYVMYPNGQIRGIIYRTINGGDTWRFQIPDTSINIGYSYIHFTNNFDGWVYGIDGRGIHTTTGGDSNWILEIKQISNEIPLVFELCQNYPNPFNPVTKIKYQIVNSKNRNKAKIKLVVYDIQGKEIKTLVNEQQSEGIYEVDFAGAAYSSGVYFYKLTVSDGKEVFTETRKMILVK